MKDQVGSKAEEIKRRASRDRSEDAKAKAMLTVGILKSTDRDAKGDVR